MPSGWCPDCEERHEVTKTDKAIGKSSSRYWRLVLHARTDPKDQTKTICDGSGKLI